MRLNKYIAQSTGMSRRAADTAIEQKRVHVNDKLPELGQQIADGMVVTLDGQAITPVVNTRTIMLNKPIGYVCSRDGQGSQTIYDLLPTSLHSLKPVGRLDKYSSGLLLMTTDGDLAYKLTHPKFKKIKKYKVAVNKDLSEEHFRAITTTGVELDDGVSKFNLDFINNQYKEWKIQMTEGRNRQIRRTFEALGYRVVKLHRIQFGEYSLNVLKPGGYKEIR